MTDKAPEVDPLKVAQQRLDALRRARVKLEEPTEAQKLAALELAIKDEEAIAEAITVHGARGLAIECIPSQLGVVIVKAPNHLTVRKFRSSTDKDVNKNWEALITPCLVYPSKEQWTEILEKYNGLLTIVGTKVLELSGAKDIGGE